MKLTNSSIHRSFVVRLYPNKQQQRYLDACIGASRFVYNFFLDYEIEKSRKWRADKGLPPKAPKVLKSDKQKLRFETIRKLLALNVNHCRVLTALKKIPEFDWLNEVNSQTLKSSIEDLEDAFKRMKKVGSGFPRFKRKGDSTQSCRFSSVSSQCVKDATIQIPIIGHDSSKKMLVHCKGIRREYLDDPSFIKVYAITVKRDGDQYFASIHCAFDSFFQAERQFVQPTFKVAGIDVGVKQPLTVAADKESFVFGIEERQKLIRLEQRRKRFQRKLARQQRQSNNSKRTRKQVQACFRKERNVRKEFAEQVSLALATDCGTVAFEDLNVRGMTASVKKTSDFTPRRGVKAKSGLNREMLRLGLGLVRQRTEQKCREFDRTFKLVDARYTSQTCNVCGCVSKLNRKSQAVFECIECGHSANADANAALNIASRALAA
jgi:putative transposase